MRSSLRLSSVSLYAFSMPSCRTEATSSHRGWPSRPPGTLARRCRLPPFTLRANTTPSYVAMVPRSSASSQAYGCFRHVLVIVGLHHHDEREVRYQQREQGGAQEHAVVQALPSDTRGTSTLLACSEVVALAI